MVPLQRACVVLAATATVCTFVALTTIGEGQKPVWPSTVVSGAKQGALQAEPIDIGFLQRGLENVDGQADFRKHMLRVQAERQQQLARGCSAIVTRGRVGARPKTGIGLSLVVNVPSPLRITYCAIPKCGTTTWLHFFERVTGRKCKSAEVHACARLKFNMPLNFKDFLPRSLVIVRDPWRRLVSAYADKFVTERHPLAMSCYRSSGKDLHSRVPVTFSEFVHCILAEYRSGRALNTHYAPQHWQCSLCRTNYSFVAKMEEFAEDFRYLAMHVFSERNYTAYQTIFSRVRRRPKELRNTSSILYEDCYRSLKPADVEALVSLYQTDAELFGYPLQPLQ